MIITTTSRFHKLFKLGYFDNVKTTIIRKWNGKKEKMETIHYLRIYGGFDIETTTQNEKAFMYHWQLSFFTDKNEIVFLGRTWFEFEKLVTQIKSSFGLNEKKRLILWIANTSFEFSFIGRRFVWSEIFAKEARQPLLARTGGLEFRECLSISGGSLAYLAKNYTETQKLKGDLDYSIIRNSLTPLTDTERQYCINDVVILAEWSKYIFDNFISTQNYIPVTKTSIIRHNLKADAKAQYGKRGYKELKDWVQSLFPATKDEYLFIMDWLFRGGYVHGRFDLVLVLLFNLHSFDKKSSYPWSMLTKYMPMTPFKAVKNPTFKKFDKYRLSKCCIIVATFRNIKSRTKHTLESKSKCLRLSNDALIDNGRVREASLMTVMLTEIDFVNYEKWYIFDAENVTIDQLHIAERGYLPHYVVDGLYYAFEKKESINKKENPRDYEEQKKIVNGYYGMTVTRIPFNDIHFIDNEWVTKSSERNYDDLRKNEILSPFWGIYICAHSRQSECDFIVDNANDIVYGDTDSGKGYLTPKVAKWLHDFNRQNKVVNYERANKLGFNPKVIEKLGCFEWETSPYEHGVTYWYKYGGAKRYLAQYKNDGFVSTIAGLPKGALNKYCQSHDVNPFEYFDKDMTIPANETGKLRAKYIDEPTEEVVTDSFGNSEVMREMSSVCLLPVEFTMSLDKDWLKLLLFHLKRFDRFS